MSQKIKAEQIVDLTAIDNVVEDTTPALGGDLQSNGNDIDFADNDKAVFGAGNDLQIYHDGSNSYISDTGTGHLKITAASLLVQNVSGNNRIFADQAGPVNLYHGTSGSPKLATSSTGVTVTGTLAATTVDLGAWTVTESSNVLYFAHSGTNKMKIDSSGNLTVVGDVTAFGSV